MLVGWVNICLNCGAEYPDDSVFCAKDGARLAPVGALPDGAQGAPQASGVQGKYRILGLLGKGGMGAVYKAQHILMDRVVAIKILHSQTLTDPSAVERFRREAQTASKLSHANAITIHDFGLEGGSPYIVMEYAEGKTLRQVLAQEGCLGPCRALALFQQIFAAVAQAHRLGIVHRDLKPDNIIVVRGNDGSETVKVLDFGLSKVLNAQQSDLTQTGIMVGTPKYSSPEQVRASEVDMRTDIYSLGVMLYEVLSGQPPFSAAEPAQLLVKHLHEAPPPLEKSVHGEPIPIELGRVVLRALSKDPAKRQQSVQELEHEFKIAVEAVAVDADETDTQVMRALPLAGHGEDRRGVLSSRILLGGVALCAVIAVFTLLFMLRGRMHLGRRLDMPAAKSANTPETLAQPLSTAAPDIPAQAWPPPFRLPPLVQEKPSAARELMLPPPGERQLLGILAEQTTPHDAPPRYPAHGWYLPFGGHMPLIGAKEREANLRTRGVPAIIQPDFGGPRRRFQVYIGPYTSAEDAQRKAQELAQKEPALPKQMLGAPVQF